MRTVALVVGLLASATNAAERPNVVFILADDLGWGDLGCYGQTMIRTPSIDTLAKDGMRFTQAYSGNAVCAPSRCCLMTGMHPGHAYIRDNRQWKAAEQWSGQVPLPADTVTLPKLFKEKGYATAAMGKWGLGSPENSGDPAKLGIDYFFGYYCQAHAHNHYPQYVWKNGKKELLDGNDGSATGKQYTQDLFEAESLKFVREHKDKPFFLYLPFTVPHLALQVPEDSLAEYKDKFPETPYIGKQYQPHATPRAAYAAMVTRMDRSVGRLMNLLKELKLDSNTIVIFASDNGAIDAYAGTDAKFFGALANFRGMKGSLYEGGIRVPLIVRWSGHIKAASTSDLPVPFWDLLPTLCAAADIEAPKNLDGLSILPTLIGHGEQGRHDFLYWEFPSYGGQQAVRAGKWKAVRQNLTKGPSGVELFDLESDPSEKMDVAADHADVVQKLERIMKEQHTPSALFPLPSVDPKPKKQ
ncbi:MAG TPA: arylsulfatase [Gemmataceae bacterium]|jgi:arylsulfatase|nr:arylsulfatase [Gemmataceae bacterium]